MPLCIHLRYIPPTNTKHKDWDSLPLNTITKIIIKYQKHNTITVTGSIVLFSKKYYQTSNSVVFFGIVVREQSEPQGPSSAYSTSTTIVIVHVTSALIKNQKNQTDR